MTPEQSLILVGGGEHGQVVAEAAVSRPNTWRVRVIVDPAPAGWYESVPGVLRIPSDDAAAPTLSSGLTVLGIGGYGTLTRRRRLARLYESNGAKWATIVHAAAWVSPSATLEPGAVVLAGAVVNAGACVGAHAIINTGAILEHDCSVGAFAFLGPGAVVGGGVTIQEDAYLGLGCRVRDHVTVGTGAIIGMGAVVVASVPAGICVMGVPARARPS